MHYHDFFLSSCAGHITSSSKIKLVDLVFVWNPQTAINKRMYSSVTSQVTILNLTCQGSIGVRVSSLEGHWTYKNKYKIRVSPIFPNGALSDIHRYEVTFNSQTFQVR